MRIPGDIYAHDGGHDDDKVQKFRITALSSAGDSGNLDMPDNTIGTDDQPAIDKLLQRMLEEISAVRRQFYSLLPDL